MSDLNYQRGSDTDHGLHGGAGDHELHLLRQHGGGRLLLDQVVTPVDLQLGLEMGRRVEVLAVLPRAAALVGRRKRNRRRRKFGSLKMELLLGLSVMSCCHDDDAAWLHISTKVSSFWRYGKETATLSGYILDCSAQPGYPPH